MSVNATGLCELLGIPELSVHTAVRPGNPATVPDFLSIMALKAAAPAKGAMPGQVAVPGAVVGLPSTGDGIPTVAGAAPTIESAIPGATQQAIPGDIAESEMDMDFDLQLPALPAQQAPATGKTPAARFPGIAAHQHVSAESEAPVPAVLTNGEIATDEAPEVVAEGEDKSDVVIVAVAPEVPVVTPTVTAAPVIVAEATPAAVEVSDEEPELAGAPKPAIPAREVAVGAPDAEAEDAATPAEASAPAVTAPTMQRPQLQRPQLTLRAETPGNEIRVAPEMAETVAPALRALQTDTETAAPATPRESAPIMQAAHPFVGAMQDAAASAARPLVEASSQGGAVISEAVLDDLLVGNAVDDAWVDQLAADVETLVKGDRREAQIHLKPRELGDLFIRIETQGSQAKVHFTVETAAAQSFIADATPRLQSMMENRGVNVQETSVDVGGGRQDRGEQPREAQAGQPFGTRQRGGGAAPTETVRTIVRQTAIERFA